MTLLLGWLWLGQKPRRSGTLLDFSLRHRLSKFCLYWNSRTLWLDELLELRPVILNVLR